MSIDFKSRHRSTFKKPADIVFSPDIFDYHDLMSDSKNEHESSYDTRSSNKMLATTETSKLSERHVTFQESTKAPQQSVIHPVYRQRPKSGKAGDVTPLDHWIATHGGTTSSYEELPHRIQKSKGHQPLTPEERVEELTHEKSFLLQELAYHKEIRAAESRFLEKATELRAELQVVLTEFDQALHKRWRERTQAELGLCSYWGIDFGDGNVEDVIF